jgi:hypothetical protein
VRPGTTSRIDVDHSHRDVEDDIDDPRRSLPSKAHVQRSAVSVGFAAGRLTGTGGTWKAHVEHSIVESGTTSIIHADHSIEMSRRTTMVVVEHFHQGPTTNLPEGPGVTCNRVK